MWYVINLLKCCSHTTNQVSNLSKEEQLIHKSSHIVTPSLFPIPVQTECRLPSQNIALIVLGNIALVVTLMSTTIEGIIVGCIHLNKMNHWTSCSKIREDVKDRELLCDSYDTHMHNLFLGKDDNLLD